MKIVIYGINYWPEITGVGKYSGEMAQWLSSKGHQVRVVTAPPYYPEWEIQGAYSAWRYAKEYQGGIEIWRVPIFVPRNPKTIQRMIHLLSFSLSSFPVAIRQALWKPDLVFFVQPTLFSALGAILLARLSGAKAVMHVQDYEVDAMFEWGMFKYGKAKRILEGLERWLMRRFDRISTISLSMLENAKNKGVADSRLILFPNWADTKFINPHVDSTRLKQEWGFESEDKLILYAGNIGKKQGLELVLDAAETFRDSQQVKFVVVGAGVNLQALQREARERRLDNVYFKPLVPLGRLPEMLVMADIHLVVQRKGVANAVLPSKLTSILSAGGMALVTAETDTELWLLCKQFPGIFECIEPENRELFVKTLIRLVNQHHEKPNKIARSYAKEYLSMDSILSRLEDDLTGLNETKKEIV